MDEPAPGQWPRVRSTVLDWLMRGISDQPFFDNLFVDLCIRLRRQGVSIARAFLVVRTNHPEWLGARMFWRPGLTEAEIRPVEYEVLLAEAYLQSPLRLVMEGTPFLRRPLFRLDPKEDDFPLLADLREAGITDYAIWSLVFTRGDRHALSFASDRPGGFTQGELDLLADLIPAFSLACEVRLRNRLARTFLETYVGPHASEQILAGATRRGAGTTVSAVILIVDLRGFTALSELWPRDDVIAMLNEYFDAVSEPVGRHGGEILKFMGDGLLAIFPLTAPGAPGRALAAVRDARAGMAALNETRRGRGQNPLGYGIGVHVGDVMYGNIGSRRRLDFTVIGPAVNVASRLETLTKTVGRAVLFSAPFVEQAACVDAVEPLGALELPGVKAPIEVFALRDDPA